MLVLHGALSGVVLCAGLFLPGWLIGRACRTDAGPVGAFLGSAALLLNLVLLLDAFGLALDLFHLCVGLAVLCAGLALLAARRRAPASSALVAPSVASVSSGSLVPTATPRTRFRWQFHHWFFLPAALGLSAIALRATLTPLSGFDTIFRWDFLAQQMLGTGHLHFYPPTTADDFRHYAWPDGIAPLIASLYLWSYLSLGLTAAWATVPVVLTSAALLWTAAWALTAQQDRRAAALACGLLGASSVLLWGVAMGQETALTALSLVAMFLFIERHRTAPEARWLLWAGIAAGVGGLAREYGLAYLGLGFFALAWWRVPSRRWAEFVLAAALVALPWYFRNWLKTGNPLYPHELGGLFPGNPVLAEYSRLISAQLGIGTPDATWPRLAALAFGLGGAPVVLGLLAAGVRARPRAPWLLALLAVSALWLWSIGQTSAGPGYAVRMLTPVAALGAVLAAHWLAPATASRRGWLLLLPLSALAVDAAFRSLSLPVEAEVRWWQRDLSAWRAFDHDAARWRAHANWAAIADAANGHDILVPDPTSHSQFVRLGAKPVPPVSPAVRFLFSPDADFATCLAHLRAEKVRFILTTRLSDLNDLQASAHPFFRTLGATPPNAVFSHYRIYDLAAPAR